jgi:hypothetical protein
LHKNLIHHIIYFKFLFIDNKVVEDLNPGNELSNELYPTGLGTIPTGIRPKNPRELTGKMFQNTGFITSHLRIL